MQTLKDIATLQTQYQSLVKRQLLSKRNICELVIPFRNKYNLTDLQALQIARNEISIIQILKYLNKEDK